METGNKDQSKALLSEWIIGTTVKTIQRDLLLTPKALGYNL